MRCVCVAGVKQTLIYTCTLYIVYSFSFEKDYQRPCIYGSYIIEKDQSNKNSTKPNISPSLDV